MNASIAERRDNCDPRALRIATTLREASGAKAAILFGSRARGDHRADSDVDILLITESKPSEKALRQLQEIASLTQRLTIPEAAGVDVGCMTPEEFMKKRAMLNSLAREVAKHGVPAVPRNENDFANEYVEDFDADERRIDWQEVRDRFNEAMETVNDLQRQVDDNGVVHTTDRNFGYMAQRSLECAYKAVLGSHGIEYPVSGPEGHNLHRLVELMRDQFGSPVPGEQHACLTEFGGPAWHAREHQALDKPALAREIPVSVRDILALQEQPLPHQDPRPTG